jgi:hypothetical protein
MSKLAIDGVFLAVLVFFLSACSSVSVEDYVHNSPTLVPEKFFDGQLSAHGIVKDRNGLVLRYFNAEITASWADGVGTLDEQFVFDDGEQQNRVWTLVPSDAGVGMYMASAPDVIGEATMQVAGNSLFLDYVLRVPYGNGTIDLRIDDRMYLVSERVLLNQSRMSKWGVDVGELVLVIRKH